MPVCRALPRILAYHESIGNQIQPYMSHNNNVSHSYLNGIFLLIFCIPGLIGNHFGDWETQASDPSAALHKLRIEENPLRTLCFL